jgi:predicted transcriptional regulator
MTDVRQRRFQLGLLQLELAKRAGIACARLSQIETGTVEPQPEELQRIRAALDARRAPSARVTSGE